MFHPFRKRAERKALVQKGKDALKKYNAQTGELLGRLAKPSAMEQEFEPLPMEEDEETTDVGPWGRG